MAPCMDTHKTNNHSDGSLYKLKLRIVLTRDLQNKESFGENWSPIASMSTLKFFLADATEHKARFHQLYFIGAFLHEKVKNSVFVKLESRYADYFPEYSNYFERSLRLLKSMYVMTNSGELFDDELTEWLPEKGFTLSQFQMFTYLKYAPEVTQIVVSSYVDDFVYWYTSEALGKWFLDHLGKSFHVNFFGYAH